MRPAGTWRPISHASAALGITNFIVPEVTRCDTTGAVMRTSSVLRPAGISISITSVSASTTGDQKVRASLVSSS